MGSQAGSQRRNQNRLGRAPAQGQTLQNSQVEDSDVIGSGVPLC